MIENEDTGNRRWIREKIIKEDFEMEGCEILLLSSYVATITAATLE
jgi:hypothetical protein